MSRIDDTALAGIDFELRWESPQARHTDRRHAAKVNFWRDILPDGLDRDLMGGETGTRVERSYPAGRIVPAHDPGLVKQVADAGFDRELIAQARTEPDFGRFFPQGLLADAGIGGIFKQSTRPFRCVGRDGDRITVDLNHPLARTPVTVAAEVGEIRQQAGDPGGRCSDWPRELTEGPGLQARHDGAPTAFFEGDPFVRADAGDDAVFYAQPRLTVHLDSTALRTVTGLYRSLLSDGMAVLDLMSSCRSHLPDEVSFGAVAGLGMNAEELAANKRLTERVIHDLNAAPRLPFPDGAFDAAVCTVSVEYLTRPFEVFADLARVLKPGAPFIVTFSNRWFPPKAVRIWTELHPFERLGLVLEYFLRTHAFTGLETFSHQGAPRPQDDPHYPAELQSDPVFAAWGRRR